MWHFHHIFPALFDGVHDLFQDLFGFSIVIDLKRFLKVDRQQRSLLFEIKSLFIESAPEAIDHNRYHDGAVLFYDQGRTLPSRGKRPGGSLGEGDDPAIAQGTFDFTRVGGIQSPSHFSGAFSPGAFHGKGAGQDKKLTDPGSFHRFFSSHIIHIGIRVQEVIRQSEFVALAPFYGAEDVQEGDHVCEISLVVTDEQHVFAGKVFNVFRTSDTYLINHGQARIGYNAYDGIYQFPYQSDLFQSVYQFTHAVGWMRKVSGAIYATPSVYLRMTKKAVILDMDGLLIDSEPYWQEAGIETLALFGISLSQEQYHSSTGLRTIEWIDHWFNYFGVDHANAAGAILTIEEAALEKIRASGKPMPGVEHIINFFLGKDFRIGLASSSPMKLIEVVVEKLGIGPYLHGITSAGQLPYGKPHPQVFLDCAESLGVKPYHSVCFEDSFNGMIAAKAAKMKCVVVPEAGQYNEPKWGAADLKLRSLANFNELLLEGLWK